MRYLWAPDSGKVYAYPDNEFDDILAQYPDDKEVTESNAYMLLFFRISKSMGKKFSNYRNADIQGEVLMMMLKRYKEKGLFAPDKPFIDNEKMWWSYAKKSCYWLIRQFKRLKTKTEDIDSLENVDNMLNENLLYEESFEFEHNDTVATIVKYLDDLAHSKRYIEMQMGIYAVSKLGGLTDEDIMDILGVKIGRIKEIKHDLKEHLKLRFGNIL